MNIILREVSKVFPGPNKPLTALASISLHIASGEFVSIIGPSGCGKSTLLRLMGDQLTPTQGEVLLNGTPPSRARARKTIAWMAQSPALLPWCTVLENVQLPLWVNRHAHYSPGPPPLSLLETMGLRDFATAYPNTLSGGMQQRVALARALTLGAPLWLMDEPFAALDELTRESLTEEVLHLWRRFRPTVVWVTHQISEAVRLANRIMVMTARPGNIRAILPVSLPYPRDDTSAPVVRLIRKLRLLLRS